MSKIFLNALNIKVLIVIASVSIIASIYLLLQQPKPVSREELVPLKIPIQDKLNMLTTGNFTTEWDEPYYIGLNFQRVEPGSSTDSLRRITFDRIGSKQLEPPVIGISWKIFDGDHEIGSGSGKDKYRGMIGNTIALGAFKPKLRTTYRIEVACDSTFFKFMESNPTIEVGIASASSSVGLALAEGISAYLFKLFGYILLGLGLLLFTISAITYIVRRGQTIQ